MRCFLLRLLLLQICGLTVIASNGAGNVLDLFLQFDEPGDGLSNNNSCSNRLHSSLEKLRKRQNPVAASGFIDLSGYALHQTLRHAPFDMYVTDIRVRTPGIGNWVRVEKCMFSTRENRLATQILFNDLTVTGNVKLFEENSLLKNPGQQVPSEFCTMTVRLKRAGLGINAFTRRERKKGINMRTEARFVDPNYLSVHAYGCRLHQLFDGTGNRKSMNGFTGTDRSISNIYYPVKMRDYRVRLGHFSKTNPRFEDSDEVTSSANGDDVASKIPHVRIISLSPNVPNAGNVLARLQPHGENETVLNDYHKERILSEKFQSERDRLKAVLHMKNLIAQQANQVFQMHGPFSHIQNSLNKPIFEENLSGNDKPQKPVTVISTITELDENLTPLRPIQQRPQDIFFPQANDKIVNANNHDHAILSQADELSREMENMFLRGIKTLLTKYVEKQLEIPLKEVLMVSIGYTVSYG